MARPPDLTWTAMYSSSGRLYYYNKRTEISQWDRPTDYADEGGGLGSDPAPMIAPDNRRQAVTDNKKGPVNQKPPFAPPPTVPPPVGGPHQMAMYPPHAVYPHIQYPPPGPHAHHYYTQPPPPPPGHGFYHPAMPMPTHPMHPGVHPGPPPHPVHHPGGPVTPVGPRTAQPMPPPPNQFSGLVAGPTHIPPPPPPPVPRPSTSSSGIPPPPPPIQRTPRTPAPPPPPPPPPGDAGTHKTPSRSTGSMHMSPSPRTPAKPPPSLSQTGTSPSRYKREVAMMNQQHHSQQQHPRTNNNKRPTTSPAREIIPKRRYDEPGSATSSSNRNSRADRQSLDGRASPDRSPVPPPPPPPPPPKSPAVVEEKKPKLPFAEMLKFYDPALAVETARQLGFNDDKEREIILTARRHNIHLESNLIASRLVSENARRYLEAKTGVRDLIDKRIGTINDLISKLEKNVNYMPLTPSPHFRRDTPPR